MNYLLNFSLLCLLFYSTTNAQERKKPASNQFELTGKIELITSPQALLIYYKGEERIKDTAHVSDGVFRFTGTVDQPTYAALWSKDMKYGTWLFLENKKMHISLEGPDQMVKVSGSVTELDNALVRKEYASMSKKMELLYEKSAALRKSDSVAADKMETEEGAAIQEQFRSNIKNFIKTHPKSYVSIHELNRLASVIDIKELKSYYDFLDKSVQLTELGRRIGRKIEVNTKMAVGMPAINFSQAMENGKMVSLSDFKGKYVLIDFWASWCAPCRAENPNVLKTYQQFKDKGFAILGVSLDDKADKWKEAVVMDKLPWQQVSDLKGWKNEVAIQYDITSIPASYLIDPNGIIVAKGLRGEALDKKLSEIFK